MSRQKGCTAKITFAFHAVGHAGNALLLLHLLPRTGKSGAGRGARFAASYLLTRQAHTCEELGVAWIVVDCTSGVAKYIACCTKHEPRHAAGMDGGLLERRLTKQIAGCTASTAVSTFVRLLHC